MLVSFYGPVLRWRGSAWLLQRHLGMFRRLRGWLTLVMPLRMRQFLAWRCPWRFLVDFPLAAVIVALLMALNGQLSCLDAVLCDGYIVLEYWHIMHLPLAGGCVVFYLAYE